MSDFDKDMSHYISRRRKKNIFGKAKHEEPPIRLHPEIEPYEAPQEPEVVEAEEAPPKKGFFSKLFGKKEETLEELEEMPTNVLEDLKHIAKIALHIAKQLPPERLEELKNSEEYIELKQILNRYGMIK